MRSQMYTELPRPLGVKMWDHSSRSKWFELQRFPLLRSHHSIKRNVSIESLLVPLSSWKEDGNTISKNLSSTFLQECYKRDEKISLLLLLPHFEEGEGGKVMMAVCSYLNPKLDLLLNFPFPTEARLVKLYNFLL